MSMDGNKFIDVIRSVSSTANFPSDVEITGSDDPLRGDGECADIASFFRGKNWQSISAADVGHYASALVFFTADALHYYLPAFLVGCIRDRWSVDTAWLNTVLALAPPSETADRRWEEFRRRTDVFNRAEAAVIVEFIEFVEETDRIEMDPMDPAPFIYTALEYWRRRAADRPPARRT